jgi:hypothetical protein
LIVPIGSVAKEAVMLALLIIPSLIGVSLMGSFLGILDFPMLGLRGGSGDDELDYVTETEKEETPDLLDEIDPLDQGDETDSEDGSDGEEVAGEG